MVILYNHNIVTVQHFTRWGQEIHALIEVRPFKSQCIFTAIYASTKCHNRDLIWENPKSLSSSYNRPWMIGGDFNDIISSNEKFGGRPMKSSRSSKMLKYINNCNLIDLGFKGCKFTRSNHRKKKGLIMERLGRILANEEWLKNFPNATTTHLPKTYSGHNPILVKLNNGCNYTHKPFRLENIWCTHPDFVNVVASNWNNKELLEATKSFTENIKVWGKKYFWKHL